jgi:hypothetical protein
MENHLAKCVARDFDVIINVNLDFRNLSYLSRVEMRREMKFIA